MCVGLWELSFICFLPPPPPPSLSLSVDPVVVPDVPGILAGDVGEPLTISFTITSAEPAVMADGIRWYFSPYPTITDGSGSGSGSGSGDDLLDVLDCENLPGEEINDSLSLSDDDVTALYISQLEYSNEGVYSVRVENRAGVDCAQTRVNVQGRKREGGRDGG